MDSAELQRVLLCPGSSGGETCTRGSSYRLPFFNACSDTAAELVCSLNDFIVSLLSVHVSQCLRRGIYGGCEGTWRKRICDAHVLKYPARRDVLSVAGFSGLTSGLFLACLSRFTRNRLPVALVCGDEQGSRASSCRKEPGVRLARKAGPADHLIDSSFSSDTLFSRLCASTEHESCLVHVSLP